MLHGMAVVEWQLAIGASPDGVVNVGDVIFTAEPVRVGEHLVSVGDTVKVQGWVRTRRDSKAGLSFTEKHRLEALPDEMERLEKEIAKLEELMADPELFTREPVKFKKATEALVERQQKLAAAEEEWLQLEEKAGG